MVCSYSNAYSSEKVFMSFFPILKTLFLNTVNTAINITLKELMCSEENDK